MTKKHNLLLLTMFLHFTDAQSSQPTHELTQPLLIVTTQQSPDERLHTLRREFTMAHNNSYEESKKFCLVGICHSFFAVPMAYIYNDQLYHEFQSRRLHEQFVSLCGGLFMISVAAFFSLLALDAGYTMYQEQKHNHPATTQLKTIKQELTQNFTPLQIATFLARNIIHEREPFYNVLTSTFNIKRVEVYENKIRTKEYYSCPNRIEKTTKSEKEL